MLHLLPRLICQADEPVASIVTEVLNGFPPHPARLTIATDGDEPGRAAGHALADRAHALGWQVSLLPALDGRDWNDILTMKGELA